MSMNDLARLTLALGLSATLGACSLFSSSQSSYEPVDETEALEIPPDLDAPDTSAAVRVPNSTYSRVAGGPVRDEAPGLGATPTASQPAAAGNQLVWDSGVRSLQLADSEESAWRRVGFALERIGLSVEDSERETGTYVVEYVDQSARDARPNVFSRWILRRKGPTDHSGTYQVRIQSAGDGVLVQLMDEDGAPADATLTEEILGALLDRLG